jgi:tricorn protease-like protein
LGNKFTGELHQPSFSIETPDTVTGMFLTPNQKYVIIGYENKNIRIYDIESQEMKKDIEGCCYSMMTNNVINVAFTPDSSLMAYRWDEGVRILNLNSFEMEKEIRNECTWVTASFSPDG